MRSVHALFSRIVKIPAFFLILFIGTLLVIGVFITFGPAEASLGTHIRIVYLHGAWVWASLGIFLLAGLCGGLGIFTQCRAYHCWSDALGKTGLFFWITYLPLSLWAMQTNWNGLFLSEPRWHLALVFAVTGLLLQMGLSLAKLPNLTSGLNLAFVITLFLSLQNTANVMHPGSPILNSGAWRIQLFFFGLVLLTLLAAWQMARWWYQREPDCKR